MSHPGKERPEPPSERLIEVGRYSRVARAHEHGLVILSMGISYWLMPLENGGYGLFVEKDHETAVREQLGRFDREHRYWPPREDILPSATGTGWSLALYALLIWGVFLVQNDQLVEAGSAAEQAILGGEWWRTITALTLHGDWAHLVGNTGGGILFFALVFRFLGHGFGWLCILLSGTLGNLLNAWGYAGSGHNSIGASTAVFGGLGIVVGFRLLRQFRLTGWTWPRQLLVPLMAGVVLLAFLGTGGERTDILAHLWGCLAGLVMGAAVGLFRLDERFAKNRFQNAFAWLTLALVIGSWSLALR